MKNSILNNKAKSNANAKTAARSLRSLEQKTSRGNPDRPDAMLPGANMVSLPYAPIFRSAVRKRLTYYDYATLTTTGGAINTYVFSCNGLYDPNITSTGHQPSGFDQMMIFFDHYVVERSKCIATFRNSTASSAPQIALSLNSTNTAPTDFTGLSESGYVIRDWLNQPGTDSGSKTLSITCDLSKFQGVPVVRDATDLWGTIASNPVEQSYYNLSIWDPFANTSSLGFTVSLEFDAWFLEPRKISPSLQHQLHQLLLAETKPVDFRKVPKQTM